MTETRLRLRFVVLAVGLPLASSASAVDWRLSKGFGVSALYSDNADTGDGEDRGESVLAFSPFVRFDGRGRRADFSLGARFELQRFVDEERNEFAPELTFSSRATLVERFAEFDASARVSQRSSAADPLVGEELTRFDETEEVYEIALGPTIGDTLGDRARYQAAYRFTAARGSGDAVVGSDVQAVSLRLLGLASAETVLTAGTEYEVARFEDGGETRAGLVGLGLGYRFRPTLIGFASTGYDRIDAGDDEEVVDGTFWSFGARWQPNARLTVQAGYGERAYGERPTASVTLAGRRSTLELAWVRELAFASGTALTDDLLVPTGAGVGGGTPGDGGATVDEDDVDTSGADDVGTGSDASAGDGIDGEIGSGGPTAPLGRDIGTIDERVDLRYTVSGRRSTVSASIGWARRERLDSDLATEGLEYGLGFRRVLSRRAEASIGWTAIENDFSDDRSRTRENRLRLAIRVSL